MTGESGESEPTVTHRDVLAYAVASIGGQERPGQVEMAHAVEAAIAADEHLLVQAGTGTGKSLAYLIPAVMHAQQVGKPAVVATATPSSGARSRIATMHLRRITGAASFPSSISAAKALRAPRRSAAFHLTAMDSTTWPETSGNGPRMPGRPVTS